MGTHNNSLFFEAQCREEKTHLKDKEKKKYLICQKHK